MKLLTTRWAARTALVALAAMASGCGDGGSDATGATCPSGSTLTYDTFGRQFFQTHCTSCHGAGGRSPNFSTVEGIRANRTMVDANAAAGPNGVNTTMPQGGTVAEAERLRLGEWLACGAP